MDRLEGKTVVVTGAASGIGLGMTEAFANRGMRVVMARWAGRLRDDVMILVSMIPGQRQVTPILASRA